MSNINPAKPKSPNTPPSTPQKPTLSLLPSLNSLTLSDDDDDATPRPRPTLKPHQPHQPLEPHLPPHNPDSAPAAPNTAFSYPTTTPPELPGLSFSEPYNPRPRPCPLPIIHHEQDKNCEKKGEGEGEGEGEGGGVEARISHLETEFGKMKVQVAGMAGVKEENDRLKEKVRMHEEYWAKLKRWVDVAPKGDGDGGKGKGEGEGGVSMSMRGRVCIALIDGVEGDTCLGRDKGGGELEEEGGGLEIVLFGES